MVETRRIKLRHGPCKGPLALKPVPEMVPNPRFERGSPALQAGAFTRLAYWANWSGYRESNPGHHLGKVLLDHGAISAWCLMEVSNPRVSFEYRFTDGAASLTAY